MRVKIMRKMVNTIFAAAVFVLLPCAALDEEKNQGKQEFYDSARANMVTAASSSQRAR